MPETVKMIEGTLQEQATFLTEIDTNLTDINNSFYA